MTRLGLVVVKSYSHRTRFGFSLGIAVVLWAWPGAAAYRLAHVAGTDEPGFGGDRGPAVAAQVNEPRALAIGTDGSVYIADTGNHRVRKVFDGIMTTIAGSGERGGSGDGGPAVDATLDTPSDVAVGKDGTVYGVTSSGLRRIDGSTGQITTLLGFRDWLYAVTNDNDGNVYLVVTPFALPPNYPGAVQSYLLTIEGTRDCGPSFEPLFRRWDSRLYDVAADSRHRVVFAFRGDYGDHGAVNRSGRVLWSDDDEYYSLSQAEGIAIDRSGALLISGRSFYAHGRRYLLQRKGSGLRSIAGGGTLPVADGAFADVVALDPQALATSSDGTIYVVHRGRQVYALNPISWRRETIVAVLGGQRWGRRWVSAYAEEEDGTLHYAQPGRRGRAIFRDLPVGTYRVYARYDEEGLSCDARDCGWSGAPDDCPRRLNDPVVALTPEEPVHRVHLQLMDSFPCL
jgi:hypothetical protein